MSTGALTSHPGSFIGGETYANHGRVQPVTNPATGEIWAEVSGGSPQDVNAAVAAAKAAFPEWSALSVSKRGELLGTAVEHAEKHLDELVATMVREQGKTIRDARIEIPKAFDTLNHYVGMSKSLRGAHTPMLDPGVDGYVLRRPLGVVVAIVPWNFPTTLLANKLGPALVAGNTVVAKPAGTTPLVTLRLAELLAEGGLPAGVFNVLTGSGSTTGTALVQHPDVRKVAFTGSTPVGEQIAALAAKGTKRVTLELGGSDPMIICDDANLAEAASAAAMGRYYNCGQACLAVKRVYVYESVADEVIEAITQKAGRLNVGPGDAPGSQLGPLHTRAQRNEVADQVSRTLSLGGDLTVGGSEPDDPALAGGFYYLPTVVVDPPRGCPMEVEEVFRTRPPDLAGERIRRGD